MSMFTWYKTYRNASVLCQSDCVCLHQTLIMVACFF